MKSLWKKMSLVFLTSTVLLNTVTACNEKSSEEKLENKQTSVNSSKAESPVDSIIPEELDKIKVILFGEESPRMTELMSNEFQQIFRNEINTEVELMYLPWTENGAGGKVDLMIASGEEFDTAIIDPKWASSSVSKGYIQDLSGVINTYLPDWKNVMRSDVCFSPYTYGDKIYAIPIGNKPSAGVFDTVCVRQDIAEELGVKDLTSLEDLDAFVKQAKTKYPNMYATYDLAHSDYIIRATSDRNLTSFVTGLYVDQDKKELVNFAESEEFKVAVQLYNDWYKNDLIPRDMLTNTITQPFEAGITFLFRGTAGTTVIENEPELKQVVPSAKTQEYYLKPEKPIYKNQFENTAFQVPMHSKKANRVALFVNTLQKNTKLADAFIYGVEGKDFEYKDGKIIAKQGDELFYQWMIFNVNISTFDERFPSDFIETYKHWDDEAIVDCTFGLAVDYSNIKNEKAQIDTVWEEYAHPMLAGIVSYDEYSPKLISALKDAGWDKYVAEIQKQLDEHLKN